MYCIITKCQFLDVNYIPDQGTTSHICIRWIAKLFSIPNRAKNNNWFSHFRRNAVENLYKLPNPNQVTGCLLSYLPTLPLSFHPFPAFSFLQALPGGSWGPPIPAGIYKHVLGLPPGLLPVRFAWCSSTGRCPRGILIFRRSSGTADLPRVPRKYQTSYFMTPTCTDSSFHLFVSINWELHLQT